MSFINICYRAALKSARYHGWCYSGGINLQHSGKQHFGTPTCRKYVYFQNVVFILLVN